MGKVREYTGKDITILYEVARCFHAEECVHGAPGVFEKDTRPWVRPDGDDPARTAEVIQQCPTGALHYHAKDAALDEIPPSENVITVTEDGPLLVRGNMEIVLPEAPLQETRVAFCRCGASANKPFCDGSHKKAGFSDLGPKVSNPVEIAPPSGGVLKVTPSRNGPLLASGSLTLRNQAGEFVARIEKTAFCCCGASANKPYCDCSHQRIGFVG